MVDNLSRGIQFKSAEQIKDLINRADDLDETKHLIKRFAAHKESRDPYCLDKNDFEAILRWKLRGQYSRQYKNHEKNTDHNIRVVSTAAFGIVHTDVDYETELRLRVLTSLSGVEIPVASAILTLCYPKNYSVIDFRGWRQIFGEKKKFANYSTKEYVNYLNIVRSMATRFNITPQEMDMAIWQYDIETNRG